MARENKGGQMALYTKANGKMGKLTVTASCTMLTATSIRVNGLKTKRMVTAPTLMQTELSMLASGKTTNSMVRALKRGQMVQFTRGCTLKGKSMEMES